jgi:hypothetical protein
MRLILQCKTKIAKPSYNQSYYTIMRGPHNHTMAKRKSSCRSGKSSSALEKTCTYDTAQWLACCELHGGRSRGTCKCVPHKRGVSTNSPVLPLKLRFGLDVLSKCVLYDFLCYTNLLTDDHCHSTVKSVLSLTSSKYVPSGSYLATMA